MFRIKKIHKIIILFIVIFLLGVYSFSVYIGYTIDQGNETTENSEYNGATLNAKKVSELD